MAFSENELPLIEANLRKFCESKNNPDFLDKLRFDFKIVDQAIELFEVRPHWKEPGKIIETPVAKLRFFRSRGEWQLYWMRQDLKWHSYDPHPTNKGYIPLLNIVDQDKHGCFFG